MSIFHLIISIALVGLVLCLVNTFVPMESRVKSILNVVVLVVLVAWLLKGFGVIAAAVGF